MRVCVASTNPVKIAAVRGAVTKSFPGIECDVVGKTVPSGVADQPMTDIETRQVRLCLRWPGAFNALHLQRSPDPLLNEQVWHAGRLTSV